MQVVACDSLLTFKMMYLRSMPALIGLALVWVQLIVWTITLGKHMNWSKLSRTSDVTVLIIAQSNVFT